MSVLLSPFLSRLQEGTEPSGERARRLAQVPGGRQPGSGLLRCLRASGLARRRGHRQHGAPPGLLTRSQHLAENPREQILVPSPVPLIHAKPIFPKLLSFLSTITC